MLTSMQEIKKVDKIFSISFIKKYGTLIILAIIIGSLSIFVSNFFSFLNFFNIARQIAVLFVLGAAQTYALINGEIDLSIGSVAGFAGIMATGAQAAGCDTFTAILVGLIVGLVFGIGNGLIITIFKIDSLITTIGLGQIAYGLAFLYTKGRPITGLSDSFIWLATGKLYEIPIPLFIILIVFIITNFHLSSTPSGRFIYAVGYNRECSLMSGLNINLIKTLSFAITGLLSGLGGVMIMSRLASGQPTAGPGYLLNAITVAYLGASILKEGEFHMLGTFVGAVFIGVVVNGMTLLNIPYYYQFIATGIILITAVGLASAGKMGKGD